MNWKEIKTWYFLQINNLHVPSASRFRFDDQSERDYTDDNFYESK